MADSAKDIMKADPIETLNNASKISLQGGGVLLFLSVAAVYAANTQEWEIGNWLILTALVGAILLGLAGTAARMYDAHLRVKLTLKLMSLKGVGDAEKAEELPLAGGLTLDDIKSLLDKQVVVYAVAPEKV